MSKETENNGNVNLRDIQTLNEQDDLESLNPEATSIQIKNLHSEQLKLKMKDFVNFTERRKVEYESKNQDVHLTYISAKVANQIETSNIYNLINCLELKPFEIIIVIINSGRGHAQQIKHDKDWNREQMKETVAPFGTDQEAVMSEADIFQFFEKCIKPQAELNKVLFVSKCFDDDSFAMNFDTAIDKLRKQQAYRELNVEVLCIADEYRCFVNSIYNPNTFEYKLRHGSSVWPLPKKDDLKLRHNVLDRWNIQNPKKACKWQMLPTATHQVIIDTCNKEDVKEQKDPNDPNKTIREVRTVATMQSVTSFVSLQGMIMQTLSNMSGKPMIMIGGSFLSIDGLQENIDRGIPILLLNINRISDNSDDNIQTAFENVLMQAKKVSDRVNQGEMLNLRQIYPSIFAYLHKSYLNSIKAVNNQFDRNRKLWKVIEDYNMEEQISEEFENKYDPNDKNKNNIKIKIYNVDDNKETEVGLPESNKIFNLTRDNQEMSLTKLMYHVTTIDMPSDQMKQQDPNFDLETAQLPMGLYKFVKSVFHKKNLHCCNVWDTADCMSSIKVMINNNKLPMRNTLEELLVLRTALDWKDTYYNLSENYKLYSKFFLSTVMIIWISIAALSIYIVQYPNQIGGNGKQILLYGTIFTTFVSGIQAYVNPIGKWMALKAAERQVDSEVWKFRARVGDYSLEKFSSSSIVRHMRDFICNLSNQTIQKANLSDSDLMYKQSAHIQRHYQYRLTDGESKRVRSDIDKPIQNKEEDQAALGSTLLIGASKPELLIDNHQSPVPPEEQMRFRLKNALEFYQSRLPSYRTANNFFTVLSLILAATGTVLVQINLEAWVALVTVVISQLSQFKEFNSYDRKVIRQNSTVNTLSEILTWWVSLNSTEKNSRDQVEKLVAETELCMADEQRKWVATSQADKIMQKGLGKEDKEEKENANSNTQRTDKK